MAPVIHLTRDDSQCQTFSFVRTECVLVVLLSEHKPDSFGLKIQWHPYSLFYNQGISFRFVVAGACMSLASVWGHSLGCGHSGQSNALTSLLSLPAMDSMGFKNTL